MSLQLSSLPTPLPSSIISHAYVRNALEKGETTPFIDTLKDFLGEIENERNSIRLQNSDHFLGNLRREVKDVRRNMKEVAGNLKTIDSDVTSSYGSIRDTVTSYKRLSKEKENVGKLLNNLQRYRSITQNMREFKDSMEKKNDSFSAAKILNMIRDDFKVDTFSSKYFIARVDEWCTRMSTKVINHSKEDLFLYYEVINARSHGIGNFLLSRTADQCMEKSHVVPPHSSHDVLSKMERILQERKLSVSLSHLIQNYGEILRWAKWATDDELVKSIPAFYFKDEQMRDDSAIKAFMNDLGSLNVSICTYALLGRQSDFHHFYRMTRGTMLSQVIWDIENTGKPLNNEEINQLVTERGLHSVLADVLCNIVGFFFVECAAKQLCEFDVLFNSSQLLDMFEFACTEIDGLIKRHFREIRNADICLQIKELLVLFCDTMSDDTFNGGIRAEKLFETCNYMWTELEFILRSLSKQNTQMALNIGMYQPYFVSNQTQYNNHIKAFKLDAIEIDFTKSKYIENTLESNRRFQNLRSSDSIYTFSGTSNRDLPTDEISASMIDTLENEIEKEVLNIKTKAAAPPISTSKMAITQKTSRQGIFEDMDTLYMSKTYPFSCALPALVRDIYVMLSRIFLFLVHNPSLSVTGFDICEVVEGVLCEMAHTMQQDMRSSNDDVDNVTISKLCQIAIDAVAVSQSLVHVKDIIISAFDRFQKQESVENDVMAMIRKCRNQFDHISTIAYEYLHDVLKHKLNELMSCFVFIDWNAKIDTGTSFEPIMEITNYLQITMQWLINLPLPIREKAHFMCCNAINEGLMSFVISDALKTVSMPSLRDLKCSISHLETFADGCSVRNLSLCFREIKTLVNILLDTSTLDSIINNPQAFHIKYKDVNMTKVSIVYGKLCGPSVDADLKFRVMSNLNQLKVG